MVFHDGDNEEKSDAAKGREQEYMMKWKTLRKKFPNNVYACNTMEDTVMPNYHDFTEEEQREISEKISNKVRKAMRQTTDEDEDYIWDQYFNHGKTKRALADEFGKKGTRMIDNTFGRYMKRHNIDEMPKRKNVPLNRMNAEMKKCMTEEELTQYDAKIYDSFFNLGFTLKAIGRNVGIKPSALKGKMKRHAERNEWKWDEERYKDTMKENELAFRRSDEYREKISKANKERCNTPEHKAKVGRQSKERWSDPEYRAKTAAAIKKNGQKPEFKKKMRKINEKRFEDPEERRKLSKIMKEVNNDPERKRRVSEKLSKFGPKEHLHVWEQIHEYGCSREDMMEEFDVSYSTIKRSLMRDKEVQGRRFLARTWNNCMRK